MMNKLLNQTNNWCEDFELSGDIPSYNTLAKTIDLLAEEIEETVQALYNLTEDPKKEVLEEVLDGFADIAFIADNGIYKTLRYYGFDANNSRLKTQLIKERVMDANDSKRDSNGNVVRNFDGKVQKPEGWVAPSYQDLL